VDVDYFGSEFYTDGLRREDLPFGFYEAVEKAGSGGACVRTLGNGKDGRKTYFPDALGPSNITLAR
jgi:hypothetical protein